MTCIIATAAGVWADRRVTGGHGTVWRADSGAAIRVPKRYAYTTHGAGHAEAAAYLAGASAVDDATIRRALRYVAKVRWDCGDGMDSLLFS